MALLIITITFIFMSMPMKISKYFIIHNIILLIFFILLNIIENNYGRPLKVQQ